MEFPLVMNLKTASIRVPSQFSRARQRATQAASRRPWQASSVVDDLSLPAWKDDILGDVYA
jgi:hypothetical protein